MEWTLSALITAAGGELLGDPDGSCNAAAANGESIVVTGATQDSRLVSPGMLFVPIRADRDGHDFIAAAVSAGAGAVLTERGEPVDGTPAIHVADTLDALIRLGAAARNRLGSVPVIGITGSAGKTTTKDMLAAVLHRDRPTYASARSFNNEIGVPLTLLNVPASAEVVVLEMGSRGAGHIADLCRMARPTMGVVTTVGLAHTSEFGNREGVVAAKRELVEALPAADAGGVAFLNSGVPDVAHMASHTAARVVTFGDGGDVTSLDVEVDDELTPSFRLVGAVGGGVVAADEIDVKLGARGVHVVDNALAAAAVALDLGVALDDVAAGLATPMMSPLRMELVRIPSGALVLNDSYNANPLSMEAALRALARLPAERRTAVVGLMAELGVLADTEHAAIGALARSLDVRLIAVDAPAYGGEDVDSVAAAVDALGSLTGDDAVLVKGSRVAELERLVDRLLVRT